MRARLTGALSVATLCGALRPDAAFGAPDNLRLGTPQSVRAEAQAETAFRVPLSPGAFARVHLESRGLPAKVQVRAPDGSRLIERDVPPGASSCSWIARESGVHTIAVRGSTQFGTRISIELIALRRASAADAVRVDQERELEEAAELEGETAEARLSAAAAESLAASDAVQTCEAAVMRRRAGALLSSIGRASAAVPILERAARDAGGCVSRQLEALTWIQLAAAHTAEGRFDASGDALDRASQATSVTSDAELLGDIELGRARLDTYRIKVDAAAHRYESARSLYHRAGDAIGEALTRLWTAYNHIAAGDPERALDAGAEALALWEEIGDRKGTGRTLQALALANQSLGRTQRALELYLRARGTLSPGRDPAELAAVFNGLAELYLESGAFDRGIEFAQLAADLNQDNPAALADSLCMLARGRYSVRQYADAETVSQRALAIYRELGDVKRGSLAQRDLARALKAAGKLDTAIPLLRETLGVLRESRAPYLEGLVESDLGEALADRGWLSEAIASFERALTLQRKVGSAPDEVLVLANLARLRARMGQLLEAMHDADLALERAEELRAALASFDLRTSYFGSVGEFQEFYVDLLMTLHAAHPQGGYDVRAFLASERTRARTFVDRLVEPDAVAPESASQTLRSRERELAARINALARRIVSRADGGEEDLHELLRLYTKTRAEHDQIESALRASDGRYTSLNTPDGPDLRSIQASFLDEDTALVEYFVGARRSFGWCIAKDGFVSFVLPPRDALLSAVERMETLVRSPLVRHGEGADDYFSRLQSAGPQLDEASALLSRILLDPWLGARRERRLLVVAHESLHHVPFAALPWRSDGSERPLIATHEVVRIPSASALAALRRRTLASAAPAPAILVVADPVFSPGDPRVHGDVRAAYETRDAAGGGPASRLEQYRLRGGSDVSGLPRLTASADEAQEIVRAAGHEPVTLLSGFGARRDAVLRSDPTGYRIVHIASHSLVNDDLPELSAVVLSMVDEGGRSMDGLLLLDDIYQMKLKTDLVVLSACDTALGRDIRGEGIVGLTRGFFHAGASRVIASLWKVDDRGTRELMHRFYERLLRRGETAAAALREAQLSMATDSRWALPYFWAGFELHGEWR